MLDYLTFCFCRNHQGCESFLLGLRFAACLEHDELVHGQGDDDGDFVVSSFPLAHRFSAVFQVTCKRFLRKAELEPDLPELPASQASRRLSRRHIRVNAVKFVPKQSAFRLTQRDPEHIFRALG